MATVTEQYRPVQITTSQNVAQGQGGVAIVFCSSSSGGTLALYDDVGTGTTKKIVDTFTLTAGQSYPMAYSFQNGLNAVITGTASITIGLA